MDRPENLCQVSRYRFLVQGLVQGVGFRPFVYQLATRLQLAGHVSNSANGVTIEVQGTSDNLLQFRKDLIHQHPPLAYIQELQEQEIPFREEAGFQILPSTQTEVGRTSIPGDIAPCDDCLRELFDPQDRRYRYPFLNCTQCGPRYTVICSLPYDRLATTLAKFTMCTECLREYGDPADRRFHAEPIACSQCGPQVWLETNGRRVAEKEAAIKEAITRLERGEILAIKGIGGFHLACDASNESTVARLREKKGRGTKPLAVMVKNLELAQQYVEISLAEAELLLSPMQPIVLLQRKPNESSLAPAVAPGTNQLGLVLPYSPLHQLLLTDRPLVMTSGNGSNEPIVIANEEARDRLSVLCDAILMHDREITTPCDDSVVRIFENRLYPLRRSRGYAPLPVKLQKSGSTVLAVGGELKTTLCLAIEKSAYLSQHLGDLESPESLMALDRCAYHLLDLFRVKPDLIACDLHPGYLSSQWAERFARKLDLPLIKVQHHEAHLASLLADVSWSGKDLLGVCFDGTGFGTDRAIWGGEFFRIDKSRSKRVGHLKYVSLPGGDLSIKRPYRLALAHLWAAGIPWSEDIPAVAACPPAERAILRQQLEKNANCTPTSSMGRLFDAVSSLLGVNQLASYEGQPAVELETIADSGPQEPYPFEIISGNPFQIDPTPLVHAIVQDLFRQVSAATISARFHATIAEMICYFARLFRQQAGLDTLGLTGGVFQNMRLLKEVIQRLNNEKFTILTHQQVPTNDGGISLGQCLIARGQISS